MTKTRMSEPKKSTAKRDGDRFAIRCLAEARLLAKPLLNRREFTMRDAVMTAYKFIVKAKREKRLTVRLKKAAEKFKLAKRANTGAALHVLKLILQPSDRASSQHVSKLALGVENGLKLSLTPKTFRKCLTPQGYFQPKKAYPAGLQAGSSSNHNPVVKSDTGPSTDVPRLL
jgi:hypothetical protein